MAISNPNPQAHDVVIYQRDVTNTYWGEVHISGSNRIIYIDSSGNLNADDSSSFYSLFPPSGSSGGSSGTTLNTGSTYPITASWAISASWAPGTGGSSLITGSLVPITSSQSVSSSYTITASWAQLSGQSVSSSWSNTSLSTSVVNVLITASNLNYYVPFVTTNSFQPVYIDPSSIYYNPGTDTLTVNIVSASFISASLFGTASWSSNSITTSFSNTASYSVSSSISNSSSFAATYPRELATGSTYQITSSWSQNSTTTSFALNFNPTATASYANNAKSASYSVLSDTASLSTAIYNPFFIQVFS